jgi:hypothetical protein
MGTPSSSWDASFEATPAGSDLLSTVDNAIQDEKLAVRQRLEREHNFAVAGTQSKHGWHKAGSAVSFFQASAPTNKIDPSAVALDTDDAGRFFVRSTDCVAFVWDGSAWQGLTREVTRVSIQGFFATGTNVTPRIVFPRACKLAKVTAYCETAPTGASLIIDINKNGNTSYSVFDGATRITIVAGAYANNQTTFHATYGVLAADDQLTIDIDQVGSTVAGSDLTLTIEVLLQ